MDAPPSYDSIPKDGVRGLEPSAPFEPLIGDGGIGMAGFLGVVRVVSVLCIILSVVGVVLGGLGVHYASYCPALPGADQEWPIRLASASWAASASLLAGVLGCLSTRRLKLKNTGWIMYTLHIFMCFIALILCLLSLSYLCTILIRWNSLEEGGLSWECDSDTDLSTAIISLNAANAMLLAVEILFIVTLIVIYFILMKISED